MPKVNPHADPTRRDLGPAALGRTVKKLFSYYPVLAPVTFVCILFSSIVSSVPSLFTQNIIQIIEKWYISRDWAAAKAEIVPDRKSTRLNSSHKTESRMPSSA